jgi:hypothetical protein
VAPRWSVWGDKPTRSLPRGFVPLPHRGAAQFKRTNHAAAPCEDCDLSRGLDPAAAFPCGFPLFGKAAPSAGCDFRGVHGAQPLKHASAVHFELPVGQCGAGQRIQRKQGPEHLAVGVGVCSSSGAQGVPPTPATRLPRAPPRVKKTWGGSQRPIVGGAGRIGEDHRSLLLSFSISEAKTFSSCL